MMDPVGLSLFLGFGMCVFLPLGLAVALVYVLMTRSRDRHAERMAMIAQGLAPPADGSSPPPLVPGGTSAARGSDPVLRLGWAVGLVVLGVLWLLPDSLDLNWFGILLAALGAAYLTRGIIGLKRSEAAPSDPSQPSGGVR